MLLLIAFAAFAPATPQDLPFHLFADIRLLCEVPRFGDVVSNVPFILVGLAGLWGMTGARSRRLFDRLGDSLAYRVLFVVVAMIGLGFGYYHWEPSNDQLFWDRSPMTVAFMAFFNAFTGCVGTVWVLLIAVPLGVESLVYWSWSGSVGRGDVRPFALIQFSPILILSLMARLFPESRSTDGRFLAGVLVIYGLAIVVALFDHEILNLAGGVISDYSLEHLITTVVCVFPLAMLRAPG